MGGGFGLEHGKVHGFWCYPGHFHRNDIHETEIGARDILEYSCKYRLLYKLQFPNAVLLNAS
jgi:hypothetical protein